MIRHPIRLALAAMLIPLANPAVAKQWSATCSDLKGMRVDDSGSGAAFAKDGIEGASWTYRWDTTTRKATLTLPASHASDGKAHKQEGTVTSHRGGFFAIVSPLPGAVWTHAIYPEAGRLLATQSTAKGSALSGRVLTGTCTLSP